MKNFYIIALLSFLIYSNNSFSQDWLPKPVNSAYFDALEGTWVSDPYQFMGNTATDVLTIKRVLNGQYLEADIVKKTNDNGFTYEGKEIIMTNADGGVSGTYFDMFGKPGENISYSMNNDGKNVNIFTRSNNGAKEIIINGNSMIQNVTFRMGYSPNLPEQKITINYKKQ